MIDCPICHVKNDDDARFCAECGQRLSPSSGQPDAGARRPDAQDPSGRQQGQGTRLNSPLLSGGPEDIPATGAADAAEVNRLRQMTSRGKDERPVAPPVETPYKNPYDPRNNPLNANQAQPQGGQGSEPPKNKLRSPLLSGEDFDDDDYQEEAPPPTGRGGHLRSPLLGGGDSGSGGGGLRSPLLGGGGGGGRQQPHDDYDNEEQGHSSSGLRSPLLGGGGGSNYPGSDRRKPTNASFDGQDRRKSGLRSPILGGSDDHDDYQYNDYDDDDEPIDEDNPNVLRSPLLAAKRPLTDRSTAAKSPAGSYAQNAARGIQPSEAQQFAQAPQSPASSYTSLRSISSASRSAPTSVPPAPNQPGSPPAMGQPQSGPPGQATAPQGYQYGVNQQAGGPQGAPGISGNPQAGMGGVPQQGGMPAPMSGGMQTSPAQGPQGWPQPGGPSSLTSPSNAGPQTQPPSPETNQAITGGIRVQPPKSGTSSTDMITALAKTGNTGTVSPDYDTPRPKTRSRMPGQAAVDEDQDYPPNPVYGGQQEPPSPLPKIIAGVACLLLLLKAWAMMGFFGSQWVQVQWLVIDQIVALATVACLIVLALRTK